MSKNLTIYFAQPPLSVLYTILGKRSDNYIVFADFTNGVLSNPIGYVINSIQRLNSYSENYADAIFNMEKTYIIGTDIFRLDHVENSSNTTINVPLKYSNKWNGTSAIGYANRELLPGNISKVIFTYN
jgi:hypothetical protein